MAYDSWDDAMLWHGSLIGYMAGVKAACKDEERLDLLLAIMTTQVKLEDVERENAKLRELVSGLEYCVRASVCDYCCPLYDPSGTDHRRCESLERELRIDVE